MSHAIGSLVKCRGREWVVLPDPGDDPYLLMLRPLGGTDDEVCGVYLPLETVEPATTVVQLNYAQELYDWVTEALDEG